MSPSLGGSQLLLQQQSQSSHSRLLYSPSLFIPHRQEGGPCLSVSYPAEATSPEEVPTSSSNQAHLPSQPEQSLPQMPLSAPRLPRMPLGLIHVMSSQCYEALAGVLRCLGHQAHMSDREASGEKKGVDRRARL